MIARQGARPGACALLVAVLGCDDGKPTGAAPPSRVVAIASKQGGDELADFCDVRPHGDSGPSFAFPPVDGPLPGGSGPRWINVWATWCPPCVEELPLIKKLEAGLQQGGSPVALTLLSVDTSGEAVTKFAAAHPEVTGSLRLSELDALEPWLVSIGLDKGATLPVHVFVSATGHVTCARTGAVSEADAPKLKRLLAK